MQAADGAVVATMVVESGADGEDAPEASEAAPVADGGADEITTEVEDADIFADDATSEAASEPADGHAAPKPGCSAASFGKR